MGVFVYINLSTMICLLVFIIFLFIIYYTKQNMNNIENKIYRNLLLWDWIVVFISLIYQVFCMIDTDISVFNIINKIYCGAMCSWSFFLTFYITIVANEHNDKFYSFVNRPRTFLLFYFLILLINLSIFIAPIDDMVFVNNEFNSVSGPAIILFGVYLSISFFISIFQIIINRKRVNKKKIVPFILMCPLAMISILVVIVIPQYAVIQLFYTLTCYVMFHTIENPDLKMITELELARDQAEKANHAKSDFLSSMSHELRTPLNAIVGLSQVIQEESDKPEVLEDARDIYQSSNNLLDIVDGILDINKIDSNKMELEEVEYDLNNILDEVKKKTIVRLNGKDIDLIFNVPSLPEKLYGDKNKVSTILNNLLSNAAKYTDNGKIQCSLICNCSNDIANITIKVSDTGRGIDELHKELLFTRFNRNESDKDSNISGTGLGLFLTKSLVDIIGGKIDVSSEVGFGSTFTVSFNQKIVKDNDTEIL